MAMQRCSQGHMYDGVTDASCPWCKTRAAGYQGTTERVQGVTENSSEKTIRLGVNDSPKRGSVQDDTRTRRAVEFVPDSAKLAGDQPIEPVVGWLVCVKGVEKGKDFRLHYGRNSLGRSPSMDVALKDEGVSREGVLALIYDPRANAFIVQSGTGHSIAYKNGNLLAPSESIEAYDYIEVGETGLVFVPLCGGNFKWDAFE